MARSESGSRDGTGLSHLAAIEERIAALAGTLAPQAAPPPRARRFPTWEVARYMLPVSAAHLRRVLAADPGLPQGEAHGPGATRWFSLEEVERLRERFAARNTGHRPEPARIIALAQAAGDTGKTVIAAHLAMAARLDGWRVLMIDLDPAAALSRRFGIAPVAAHDGALGLLARHHGEMQQARNRERVSRGEAMLPLGPEQSRALRQPPEAALRQTAWPGLRIIPAGLGLARADLLIPAWRQTMPDWRPWQALPAMLRAAGLLDGHDLVIIDTGPGLGWLALAGLAAADLLLVPVRPSAEGCAETAAFLALLQEGLGGVEAAEAAIAQALGLPDFAFRWQGLHFVISRFSGQAEAAAIEAALGGLVLPGRLATTPMIGPAGPGLYAADYRDFGRETYIRAREPFDALWAGLRAILTGGVQASARR